MEETAIQALVNSLLMCSALFDGPTPNMAELKVLEYKDGEIWMQTRNWNGSLELSRIPFSGPILMNGANLQMVVDGDRIELGGHVNTKSDIGNTVQCPVAGDTNGIRMVTRPTMCDNDYFVYRIKDRLYGIGRHAYRYTFIFSLGGSVIEEKKIPIEGDDDFGVNQAKGTYVYTNDHGDCKEVTVGPLTTSWEPHSCDGEKITLVANEASGWHHVPVRNKFVFFQYKWSPWGGAWRREKKPVPNTGLEKDGWSSNRDRDDDAPRDSYGNVDCNLRMRRKSIHDIPKVLDLKDSFRDEDLGLLLPQTIFGGARYRHVAALSHGRMSVVHKYRMNDEAFVAIKFMVVRDEMEMERAKQEVALLEFFGECKGSHPKDWHLAVVDDWGHYPNLFFYIMLFFERSIQDVLDDLPCSNYGQKLNVCYQMLQGILELQRLGYAHGDLKPANYMQKKLDENKLHIVGFGFVKKFGAKRPAGCGTLEYMSLPALRGQEVSMVDDMQSWFQCCVVVLTGEFAYSRPTPDETEGLVDLYLKAQTEDVPQFPSKDGEIIAKLRDLIWDKPPGNTIDMAAVSKTIDEFRVKLDFKYTDPWWNSLPTDKPSSAKSRKKSEITHKSKP
uniref:Protein kinase domain-containing protein n=1 Tax=Bursaphelenchus xylophilus TaxID=6326 RepID=A0A1I7RU05_BURXY